jgi:hypothetical protein
MVHVAARLGIFDVLALLIKDTRTYLYIEPSYWKEIIEFGEVSILNMAEKEAKDLVQLIESRHVFSAVKLGHLETVQWLWQRVPTIFKIPNLIRVAEKHQQVEILSFLKSLANSVNSSSL